MKTENMKLIDAVLAAGLELRDCKGLSSVKAKKIILPKDVSYQDNAVTIAGVVFMVDNPRLCFAKILAQFPKTRPIIDAHETAVIGKCCNIGGDGFGYIKDGDNIFFMPHHGSVKVGKNVAIHNNVNIDRGVIDDTEIGEGTKIDSLVHIAHGAKIGKNCLIVAGSIIGGSVVIGDNSYIGMGAKIKNKVKIGKGVTVGAGAVVLKDIPDFETWVGVPAKKLEK